MIFGSIHLLDLIIVVTYLSLVIYLGHRKARQVRASQEGFFLAGRSLGKVYQFFLNFGNSADITGAVSTASLVYRQGVSGVWLGFQLVFLNPYYWFMNAWFRRVRLVTMADLFTDRLGSRGLATFYAVFWIVLSVFVVIGFGNLVTYKISAALVVKPEAAWSAPERAAVEGYRELQQLRHAAEAAPLGPEAQGRLERLREREARGELKSFITALDPMLFYLGYTLVVGFYVIVGGMAATAVNEVLQSLIIVAFSILLIPTGLAAIGGGAELRAQVPAAMFELVGTHATQHVTALSLFALFLVALIQINGILGNMAISGSATNEYAARFGAVAGTYGKRLMFILWAFTGLIAVALFHGADALSDPDLVWGSLARRLLGPGLLGLVLVGVIAANMSHIAAQCVAVSALFVRNIYQPLFPGASEAKSVRVARWTIFAALTAGIGATLLMDSVYSALVLLQTAAVPLGATVMLMFFWRRLTVGGAWAGILIATALNVVGPFTLAQLPALRYHPLLTARAVDETGRLQPIYFDAVARRQPDDPRSALEGSGRLNLELVVLKLGGVPVERLTAGHRFAARFFVDALTPFLFLLLVSLVTRPPARERIDLFYGRMKTAVGATPELEAAAIEATRRDPHRFDHLKLLGPDSAWEFTRWDRVDTVGFLSCCAVSGGIITLLWSLLRLAARGAL
jgi:Na+/proline symporter